MRNVGLWCLLLGLLCGSVVGQALNVVPDGGFESGGQGAEAWTIKEPVPMSSYSTEQAHSGKWSMKTLDSHGVHGSHAISPKFPVENMGRIRITLWVYAVSGRGLGIYLIQYDKDGNKIPTGEGHVRGVSGSDAKWVEYKLQAFLREETTHISLYFHSYSHAKVHAYIDDIKIESLPFKTTTPWEPKYKLSATDTSKLTAADVVGPDGIVYPNWTKCGREGGIPDIKDGVNIRDFGGIADDDKDDSAALAAAIEASDGGAVVLNAGTYILANPVVIEKNGVVIRGAGMGKTKLLFTYSLKDRPVHFATHKDGDILYAKDRIEIQAIPTGLQRVEVFANGKMVHMWKRGLHSGNTFHTTMWGGRILKHFPKDVPAMQLTAKAMYEDGMVKSNSINVAYKVEGRSGKDSYDWQGVLHFKGESRPAGERIKLVRDGLRGDTTVYVASTNGLSAGDCIIIEGPATKRWKTLTDNACRWGTYRKYAVRIASVGEGKVVLEQPLRIDFPVIDGSFILKIIPIMDCGVEDLTIEQTEDLWITSVWFRQAWNCWARNVEVIKCGRFPVYGAQAKFCEFRNMIFRDAWFKGGGGTAYAGWEHSWDCLIDGMETFEFRHAPLFQWAAAGNVIRNGVFHNSDAQWHSGWTNENLMENCVVKSANSNGAYGYGMWASPPEDDAHGPNGPRNVVYNCDIMSPRDGLWMGGMNENWLILHNRFVVEKGVGVMAKDTSFDHIIKGNVFVIKQAGKAAMDLRTPDCFNVDFQDNIVYGDVLTSGFGKKQLNLKGNVLNALPAEPDKVPRPRPAVPSIYEWQLKNVKR